MTARPFRAPTNCLDRGGWSVVGAVGSVPGEITMAHRGVLFLDELGSCAHGARTRCPTVEERVVRISRQATSLTFPAAFQLVACSNPVPAGGRSECRCPRRAARALPAAHERAAPRSLDYACASTRPSQRPSQRVVADVAGRVRGCARPATGALADWPFAQNAHVAAGLQ